MKQLVEAFANGKSCFVVCWDNKPQLITDYKSACDLCKSGGPGYEVWQMVVNSPEGTGARLVYQVG